MTTTTDLAVPEVEDTSDIQPAALLNEEDARAITARILQGTIVINDLVVEAFQRRAWSALGYESWDEYLDGEFGGAPLSLPREKRKEAVESLRGKGLSLRAIASATGTSPQTVANDIKDIEEEAADAEPASPVQFLDTSQLTEEQHVRFDELAAKEASDDEYLSDEEHAELKELRETVTVDAEIVEDEEPEPVNVVGLDGKEYKAKAEPKEPKTPAVRVPAVVKTAKKVAALLDKARIAYDELTDSDGYEDADKDTKAAVDKALAYSVVDFAESAGLKAPVRWTKIAN